jgi:hypothetical protein
MDMDETTIGLDDLVLQIGEHLAETDTKYRFFVADRIGAIYEGENDVDQAISSVLDDPNTEGRVIVDLANDLLTPSFVYEGDSIVTVSQPSEDAAPAA